MCTCVVFFKYKRVAFGEETKIVIIINFNITKIRLKQMNFRIKVCQGCRGPLQSSSGTVTQAPFDFCVARRSGGPTNGTAVHAH